MSTYGQHCPVAKAAEIFDERWTLLVIRELVAGSRRFNDIHRGVPKMSRTLLSKRLKQLADRDLVERRQTSDGPVYELTDSGAEFEDVVLAMGEWGARWMGALSANDLDPAFLLWDMHRRIDTDALPDGQTVLGLSFGDVSEGLRDWWLVMTPESIEVCDHDPGFDTDVLIEAPIRTFVDVWRGELGWNDALKRHDVQVAGSTPLRRQVPSWLQLSPFADVPRPTAPS